LLKNHLIIRMLADQHFRLRSNLTVKQRQLYRLTEKIDHLSDHEWGFTYVS